MKYPSPWWLAIVGAVAGALLVGCAQRHRAFQPLNRAALRVSQPRTLVVRVWPTPAFDGAEIRHMFAAGLFPALIAGAMRGSFESIEGDGLRDPAILMRVDLSDAMARRFSLEVLDPVGVDAYGRLTNPPPNGQPTPDLVLDVRTDDWGFVVTRPGHVGAKYSGSIALIDMRTKKVLAQSLCTGQPLDDPNNPTVDELKAGGEARLKAMVAGAADFCFQDYRKRVLGLY